MVQTETELASVFSIDTRTLVLINAQGVVEIRVETRKIRVSGKLSTTESAQQS